MSESQKPKMKIRDVMTRKPMTLARNDALSLADDRIAKKGIRHFPVVEGGRVVGVLSHRDLVHAAMSSAMGFGEKASAEFLKSVPVKEVMSDEVVTASPDDDIKTAARVMIDRKIGCLPVVEDGVLVGIVTETDLLRVVAAG